MRIRVVLLPIIALFAACSQVDERMMMADRSNDAAYRLRYTDISASLQAAEEALTYASDYPDGRAEALCGMAYVAYQQMRYDQALYLLRKVRAFSRNQLELLCADVLTMKVMQRIGEGKAFFDARLRAQKRLRRILPEEGSLSLRQKRRLHYALTELHIVASTYYYYLGQDEAARQEIGQSAQYIKLETDTTQWLYYHYMLGSGGLVVGTPDEVTLTEFDHLFRAYTLAKANHFTYFEANTLQSFSDMVCDSLRNDLLLRRRHDAYSYLLAEHSHPQADSTLSPRHRFAAAMSRRSVVLFQKYRDLFQTANAMRTLGEVYFSAGRYDQALKVFQSALHLASGHRRSPYQVTPWLAGIHENLSLTYSALGDKPQADTHRSTYLDLLDLSRQNRELDSRKALLAQEARSEQIQFLLLLLLVVAASILSAVYYRQLKRRSLSSEQKVREIAQSETYRQAEQRLHRLLHESEERLEEGREECQVIRQRVLAQQQRHVVQRTKLSVVYAIIPYLDRISHEVRKLIEKDGNTGERLSYIKELCSGMMAINDRLTSWIQVQQGRLGLHVTRFPLGDVLNVVSMQQSSFAARRLTLDIPATDLRVKADKPLTLFMVNTLLDNARKFTPEEGKVAVRLDSTEEYVEVSVCDTGIGLSPDDVRTLNGSKVYDPDRIGAEKAGKGFGFGIMNCKGIIGSYKKLSSLFDVCDFGVESERGKGSRFWFRLPRVAPMLLLLLCSSHLFSRPSHSIRELYDSVYAANLEGRYAEAYAFSEQATAMLAEPVDTPLLVSLYNEQAIAAQALGWWEAYHRSNAECVRLHRLYSTDSSLASDCQRLEKMTEDSRVLYVLIVLLLTASLALFYRVVLRHRLRHRASLDDLYQHLFSALQSFPQNIEALDNDLKGLASGLEKAELRQAVLQVQQTFASGIGKIRETESAAEDVEEKAQRLRFEHDRLYVMNQILDNSLSTIKHETMYFPSRIRQMASSPSPQGETDGDYSSLLDLVTYYRHIYMLLYEQAQGQTDPSPLRLQPVAVSRLFAYARSLGAVCQPADAWVRGDENLLLLLFGQLLSVASPDAALSVARHGTMCFITCSVEGQKLTQEQLAGLFSPQTERIEYLVMRQIVREHDAACGHPGLRLGAENTERGYRIFISLLATDKS